MLDCFKKKPAPIEPVDVIDEEVVRRNEGAHRKYKRIAFINPHTDSSSGCSSYKVSIPELSAKPEHHREYDLGTLGNIKSKKIIDAESFSMSVKIFSRDGIGISGVRSELKKWKPDVVIARHLNSIGHKKPVEGRELLMLAKYKGTPQEEEARRFLRLMNHYIGPSSQRGDDGIRWCKNKTWRKKMRGQYNLEQYDVSSAKFVVLTEDEFIGTRTATSARLLENGGLDKWARAHAEFCLGTDV